MGFRIKRLSTKLMLPVIIGFILLNIVLYFTILHYQKVNKKYVLDKEIESFETRLNQNINRIGNKGVYIASIFAAMDTVISIYEAYHHGADFDEVTAQMELPITQAIASVEENLGITPRIHFHVAPALSFYRCWTVKRGDDLSSFRRTVLDVNQSGKTISGIEVGRGGFVVRGIVPIRKDNQVIGSVESYFSMKEVMKHTKLSDDQEVAIFMDTRLLDVATKFASTTNIADGSATIGSLVLLDKTSDKFRLNGIQPDSLNQALQYSLNYALGNYEYVLTPIKNFEGKVEGVGVLQVDISETNTIFGALSKAVLRISAIALIILISMVVVSITRIVSRRIKKVDKALESMAQGLISEEILMKSQDELGNMVKSFNRLIQRTRETAHFAHDIGVNKYDTEFKSLSEDDLLGNALLEMREELKKAKNVEQKREEENEQRTWAAQGVALFSDILRNNNENVHELADRVIHELVKYTQSNQGGIFIVNEDDPKNIKLEMAACYAYGRKKMLQKELEPGEGLVGRCFQEQELIYLTDIPDSYINITSGLGDSNPTCLLLIPLSYNDQVMGILEIASFNEYKKYELEFIERIGESIAGTISLARSNVQSAQLLEKSQQQAEEMLAQEEELRQNMEEMQATQEETQRREKELEKELRAYKEKISQLK